MERELLVGPHQLSFMFCLSNALAQLSKAVLNLISNQLCPIGIVVKARDLKRGGRPVAIKLLERGFAVRYVYEPHLVHKVDAVS